jgi:hypothetical protein
MDHGGPAQQMTDLGAARASERLPASLAAATPSLMGVARMLPKSTRQGPGSALEQRALGVPFQPPNGNRAVAASADLVGWRDVHDDED